MDPATLASIGLSVLGPYATRRAEEFIAKAGRAAYDKVADFMAGLRGRWAKDSEAAESLARFEEKPAESQSEFLGLLRRRLGEDRQLATSMDELLRSLGPDLGAIQSMGPALEITQEMEEYLKDVTGLRAAKLRKGKVVVTQKAKHAEHVVGAELDEIG